MSRVSRNPGSRVLTHADLRSTARIRALTDHLVQALAAQRDALEGRRPRGS